MAIHFIKVDGTAHLRSLWNISQNKIAAYAACMEKIGIQINNICLHIKREKLTIYNNMSWKHAIL